MQYVSDLVDKGWERRQNMLSLNPMLYASGFVVSKGFFDVLALVYELEVLTRRFAGQWEILPVKRRT